MIVHGVLRHGKCYTSALIPVHKDAESGEGASHRTPVNSVEATKMEDPEFAEQCRRATMYSIYAYQEMEMSDAKEQLKQLPSAFCSLPVHEYIQANTPVNKIQAATERWLWHQRLGHPSDYYLYNAHKHIDGVPEFKHMTSVLDQCPTCIAAKQSKNPAGPNSTRVATMPYQGLSVDFGFAGVRSKNKDRQKDYVGHNGETAWILISDHFTRMKHGDTRVSKAPPVEWIRNFLFNHAPADSNKYVYMDQGGELFQSPEIVRLFKQFGYAICPTGADSSNQNGPVERGHLVVENACRAFLSGANLPAKFWPYAFHHWLQINNCLPSCDQSMSPLEMATGKQHDFSVF